LEGETDFGPTTKTFFCDKALNLFTSVLPKPIQSQNTVAYCHLAKLYDKTFQTPACNEGCPS